MSLLQQFLSDNVSLSLYLYFVAVSVTRLAGLRTNIEMVYRKSTDVACRHNHISMTGGGPGSIFSQQNTVPRRPVAPAAVVA